MIKDILYKLKIWFDKLLILILVLITACEPYFKQLVQYKNKILTYFNATPVRKVWKWFIYLNGGFWVYIFFLQINFLWLFGSMPSIERLENPKMSQASELYTSDGNMIGRYYKENRSPVDYTQLSPNLIKALVSTEDVRFEEHSGIDLQSMFSIIWYSLKGDRRGGSTLSQQLAKNLYQLRGSDAKGLFNYIPIFNTIIIKTKEWITSVKLERAYTKKEILTMYLNTVDFGNHSFGIKTASKTYFSTSPLKLSIQESATLVGLLKATSTFNPRTRPEKSKNRRNTVLEQMYKYNHISKKELDSLVKLPIVLKFNVEKHYEGAGTYFRGIMNTWLNKWCSDNGYDLYTDGLKIYTTIDSRIQKHAEDAVELQMKKLQKQFYVHWKGRNPWVDEHGKEIPNFIETVAKRSDRYKKLLEKYPKNEDSIWIVMNTPCKMKLFAWNNPVSKIKKAKKEKHKNKNEEEKEVEDNLATVEKNYVEIDTIMSPLDSIRYYKHFLHAGYMVMDPYSGQIKAWVGGINYKYFKYDHVRQAKRQPGSTFKPFVYLAAIDRGISPCSKMIDKRVTVKYKEEENGIMVDKVWEPSNSDCVFTGEEMTLRRAMAKSVNSITAQLTEKIGWETVVSYAKRMGIKSPLRSVPSIGLGSSDVCLYELLGAYATFLNHGVHTTPIFITRIEDRHGNILHESVANKIQVISEETAHIMLHMLKGGLEEPGGTSQALFEFDLFKGNQFGGKTGTSSNHSDGWFIGLNKDLIAGSWVGGDDRCIHFRTSSMGEGARTALPIFGHFMEKIYADTSLSIKMGYFPKPRINIKRKYICPTRIRARVDSTVIVIDSL